MQKLVTRGLPHIYRDTADLTYPFAFVECTSTIPECIGQDFRDLWLFSHDQNHRERHGSSAKL